MTTKPDIVERLRGYVSGSWGSALHDAHDAANEIERLRVAVQDRSDLIAKAQESLGDMQAVLTENEALANALSAALGWPNGISAGPLPLADALRLVAEQRRQLIMLRMQVDASCNAEELRQVRAEIAAKQAQIDRLMLEFCPDEMTPEQIEEWRSHQRPAKENKE